MFGGHDAQSEQPLKTRLEANLCRAPKGLCRGASAVLFAVKALRRTAVVTPGAFVAAAFCVLCEGPLVRAVVDFQSPGLDGRARARNVSSALLGARAARRHMHGLERYLIALDGLARACVAWLGFGDRARQLRARKRCVTVTPVFANRSFVRSRSSPPLQTQTLARTQPSCACGAAQLRPTYDAAVPAGVARSQLSSCVAPSKLRQPPRRGRSP